jgi:ribosome-binding protein aMBF1 (putative translation factor)
MPKSWTELKAQRLDAMSTAERVEYDRAYAAAALAAEVGERVREAREAAGFSQRELAQRMGTSRAAVDRLEARRGRRHPHDAPARGQCIGA